MRGLLEDLLGEAAANKQGRKEVWETVAPLLYTVAMEKIANLRLISKAKEAKMSEGAVSFFVQFLSFYFCAEARKRWGRICRTVYPVEVASELML